MPAGPQIVPLNFVPSEETMRTLVGVVDAADLVLATNAAQLPEVLLRRVRRLLRIGWTMEGGLAAAQVGAGRRVPA